MVFILAIQTILTFMEIIGIFWFVSWFFGERVLGWRRFFLSIAIILIGILTSYQRIFAFYSGLYLLFCIIISILIAMVCYKRKKRDIILIICLYFESIYCFDLLFYIIGNIIWSEKNWITEVQLSAGTERILIYMLSRAIIIGFVGMIRSQKKWLSILFDKMRLSWIIIIVLEIVILYMCDIVMVPGYIEEGISNARVFSLCIPIMILLVAVGFIKHKYDLLTIQQEKEIALYHAQHEMVARESLKQKQLYHDINYHFLILKKMIQEGHNEQAIKYLEQLNPTLQVDDKINETPIYFLISQKIERAREAGIKVDADYKKNLIEFNTMEIADWCTLIGNLWDNAIEGCCMVKKFPWIEFSIKHIGNAVSIHIRNSCSVCEMSGDIPVSSKKDKSSHGIGFKSILYVTEKYHGYLEWKCKDYVFDVKVTCLL